MKKEQPESMKQVSPEARIALVSPSAHATSETFIQAHKMGLKGKVWHYHNGFLPRSLEGEGGLQQFDIASRLKRKVYPKRGFDVEECALIDSLKKNQIQVVLAEYGPTGSRLTPICQELGIPLVVHFHGYDASQYDVLEKHKDGYERMFNYASAIVGVSSKMIDMLNELGAPKEKLSLAPCDPSSAFFDLTLKPKEPFEFLFVGRFVDKKAPYYLVLAFEKALQLGAKAHLTLAGDGALFNATKNLVKALNLTENISLIGSANHTEVLELMTSASCYVQHSIRAESGDMEGTPVAVMEAAAAGLPVISTKHAGIPDVIAHGETGLLVDEHDIDAMAQHMYSLSANIDVAKDYGQASKLKMKKAMADGSSIDLLNSLIQKALK